MPDPICVKGLIGFDSQSPTECECINCAPTGRSNLTPRRLTATLKAAHDDASRL